MSIEKMEILEDKVNKVIEMLKKTRQENTKLEDKLKTVTERLELKEKECVKAEEEKKNVKSRIENMLMDLESIQISNDNNMEMLMDKGGKA